MTVLERITAREADLGFGDARPRAGASAAFPSSTTS